MDIQSIKNAGLPDNCYIDLCYVVFCITHKVTVNTTYLCPVELQTSPLTRIKLRLSRV